jgi:hypothetical protein
MSVRTITTTSDWLAGDTAQARRYADSARMAYETQLRGTPDDNQLHLFRGLALAQATGDENISIPYSRRVLARLSVAVGDHPRGLPQATSDGL